MSETTKLFNGSINGSGPGRDLEKARLAYETRDIEATRAAHECVSAQENHGGSGSAHIKSIVFGGLDGIITTFAVVAASSGAGISVQVLIVLAFSTLIGDGLSMGMGDYLSEKAELDFVKKEKSREEWEFSEFPEGERKEMVELYVNKGMSVEDAETVIGVMSRYSSIFVDLMVVEELGLMPPNPDDNPFMKGVVTFLSFIVFGSIPVWIYVLLAIPGVHNESLMLSLSMLSTAVSLFGLGCFSAAFTKDSKIKTGILMTLNGGFAAGSAYLVSWALQSLFAQPNTPSLP